jgi:predicted acetyltransferase
MMAAPAASWTTETSYSRMPTVDVALDRATRDEAGLLANLIELYVHDLSDVFPNIELGPDGRFGYAKLPLFWSEPERRFPFIIRCNGKVSGFVLATRGSPVSANPDVFDIAEFFVVRSWRRSGVGRSAAFLLWDQLRGAWTVRVAERNAAAGPFWADAIAKYSAGGASEFAHPQAGSTWRVFTFDSSSAHGQPKHIVLHLG